MRLLLDTHAFVWASEGESRLGPKVRAIMQRETEEAYVSIAVGWEIAIKAGTGRVIFPIERFEETLGRIGFKMLPIKPAHVVLIPGLPPYHRDPFDRMMVAQARAEGLILVTADRVMTRYGVPILDAAA